MDTLDNAAFLTTIGDSMSTDIATIPANSAPIAMTMATLEGLEGLQRAAKMLVASGMLPDRWKGDQGAGIANCAILLEMATRIGANPIAVAQNLYVVHGTPAWSAQFLIAAANASGRFSSIRFEFRGAEGSDDWACRAWARDRADGERLDGTWVSVGDAKRAGWFGRKDSKWQSMPEQMLRYRAGAYWVRSYCPEIAMGMGTREEAEDSPVAVDPEPAPVLVAPTTPRARRQPAQATQAAADAEEAP